MLTGRPVRTSCFTWLSASLCVLGALIATPAIAQVDGQAARDEANRTKPYRAPSMISAQARFGELGEDWFFTAVFQLNYNQDDWGVGVQLPLRMRLKDRDPQDNEVLGVLRKQDWDQPSDFLRFLRYFYIGESDKEGPYFVQGGELANLTVGHGTLMHRYNNNVDISRWRAGVNAATNLDGLSIDAMAGDVLSPNLIGTRVAVRPFELARGFKHEWWDELEFGTTFFADWVAPFELQKDDMGQVQVDDNYTPIVTEQEPFFAFGFDVGLPIKLGKSLTLIPYTDINKLSVVNYGWGLHLGTLWKVHVGRGLKHPFEALFRAEFRHVSGDYLGQYFNTVYEIERYQRLTSRGGEGQPKLRSLCAAVGCGGQAPPSRNGVWFEASLGLRDVFALGAEYLAYDRGRDDGSFRLFVEVPYFKYAQVKAFYYRINTSGLSDAFGFDDRTALLAELRIPFLYVLSGNFRWVRIFQAQEQGGFRAVDDWSVGLGVYVKL